MATPGPPPPRWALPEAPAGGPLKAPCQRHVLAFGHVSRRNFWVRGGRLTKEDDKNAGIVCG